MGNGFTDKRRKRFNGQEGQIQRMRNPWSRGWWRVKFQGGQSVNAPPENLISAVPPHLGSILSLVTKSGEEVPPNALAGKTVALYFSALWCPYCVKFTPNLTSFYN